MEQRVSTYTQYSISSNVNASKNNGSADPQWSVIQKIYSSPTLNLDSQSHKVVVSRRIDSRADAPGIEPPIVVQFQCVGSGSASSASIRIA